MTKNNHAFSKLYDFSLHASTRRHTSLNIKLGIIGLPILIALFIQTCVDPLNILFVLNEKQKQ